MDMPQVKQTHSGHIQGATHGAMWPAMAMGGYLHVTPIINCFLPALKPLHTCTSLLIDPSLGKAAGIGAIVQCFPTADVVA